MKETSTVEESKYLYLPRTTAQNVQGTLDI
jgi:hypothetical protein